MKKIISALIVILLLSVIVFVPAVFASSDSENGAEDRPDWYRPGFSPADVYHNDPGFPRLTDKADLFSRAEELEIISKLAEMKTNLHMDFVVVTDNSTYGGFYDTETDDFLMDYSKEFYDMNGYGVGDNYSGAILFIYKDPRPGYSGWWGAGTGDAEKFFTRENVNHLDDEMEPYMVDGDYANGVLAYLDSLSYLIEHGKFPVSVKSILTKAAVAVVVALVIGLISLGRASASMRSVAVATRAKEYLDQNSFNIRYSNDRFLNTTTSRTLIESSTRSGGGGSSYRSGSHSSGGHSFSGGGRRF